MVPAGTRLVPPGTAPATVSDRTLGHCSGTRHLVEPSDWSSGSHELQVGAHSTLDEALRSTKRRARNRRASSECAYFLAVLTSKNASVPSLTASSRVECAPT